MIQINTNKITIELFNNEVLTPDGLPARRVGVDILADFVDLATQVAPLVRRQAADAARHFGVAAGVLHGAALLFCARLVAARIDLARLLLLTLARFGLARLGRTSLRRALLRMAVAALVAVLLAIAVTVAAGIGMGMGMGQRGAQQTAAHQQLTHGGSNAKRCACCRVYFFVIDAHLAFLKN